ncbi:UDP-glucose dehydrogenase family protein [Nanoarchaeota archaeon]
MNMDVSTISVIGLGKLGFPLAVCWARKGYNVIGVDLNKSIIDAMNNGKSPYHEANLQKYLGEVKDRLKATDDINAAVASSQATLIIVPTPSMEEGNFSNEYILEACKKIGAVLKDKQEFHLIAIVSTVMPGSMDNEIKGCLESASGKKAGVDFGLCYNPEFIALGSIIQDLYNPDFVLIGESDSRSGEILYNMYKKFCDNNPEITRMKFINAELTKLCLNTFVTMKISYANMLTQLCERLAGANIDVITNAVGLDSRIGKKYLKGAVSFGGPCFPRDNRALIHAANEVGLDALLPKATNNINNKQTERVVEIVMSKANQNSKVSILGLTYKPNTEVVEESAGIILAKKLMEKNIPTILYDPSANKDFVRKALKEPKFADSIKECINQSDVIVITTPWEEFRNIVLNDLEKSDKLVVIDCWRILDAKNMSNKVEYIGLGIGPKNK